MESTKFKVILIYERFTEKQQVREVSVPNWEIDQVIDCCPTEEKYTAALLEKIFYYGQNDFQDNPERRSVSVGDIIVLNKCVSVFSSDFFDLWMVSSSGFSPL